MTICFILFATLATACLTHTASGQSLTLDFDNLPLNTGMGYVNGAPGSGAPGSPGDFRSIGEGDNFGTKELLQLWGADQVEFFNAYTDFGTYDSWRGFSWSQVQDSTTSGFGNQYAAFPGGDSSPGGDGIYAVAFGDGSYFNLAPGVKLDSVDLTNTTYAAIEIRDGGNFSDPFEANDLFSVTLTGYEYADATGNVTGSLQVDLASDGDFVLDTWQTFDLTGLRNARSVGLAFSTTDAGVFGPNTPYFVALDNLKLNVTAIPEPNGSVLVMGLVLGLFRRRRKKNSQKKNTSPQRKQVCLC